MVKYGRHLLFLRQRLPEDVYLVDYKGIQSKIDPERFVATWKEALQTVSTHDGDVGAVDRSPEPSLK